MCKRLTSDDLLAACCVRYAMLLPECGFVRSAIPGLDIWADTTVLAPLCNVERLEWVINTWPDALEGKTNA